MEFIMQDNVINAFAEQAKNMYSPVAKFNQLMVDNMEKMTQFQLDSIKSYSEIGLGQLRSAAEIKDLESFRSYSASQAEAASAVNKKIIEDAKTFTDMSLEFKTRVEEILDESRAAAPGAPGAAKTEKRAAKTA